MMLILSKSVFHFCQRGHMQTFVLGLGAAVKYFNWTHRQIERIRCVSPLLLSGSHRKTDERALLMWRASTPNSQTLTAYLLYKTPHVYTWIIVLSIECNITSICNTTYNEHRFPNHQPNNLIWWELFTG